MPRRSLEAHAAAADIAAAQDGLITASQLASCGFPPATVNARIRSGGPWLRVLPGVYDVRRDALVGRRRHRAALLYAGPGAVLSGRAALAHLDLRSSAQLPGGNELVLIRHAVRRQSSGFVTIERTKRLTVSSASSGLALAPVPRALIDLARHCRSGRDVDALFAEALRRNCVSHAELTRELKEAPIRGSALARSSLEALQTDLRSGPEIDLYRLWTTSNLPRPEWNVRLHDAQGAFLAIPDAYLSDLGIAVEVDSRQHHSSADDWSATLHRHSRMTAAGLVVLHYTPTRIRDDGANVIDEIRRTIQTRSHAGRSAPVGLVATPPRPAA